MNSEVARQARCVASSWEQLKASPEWAEALTHFDLGIPVARLTVSGLLTPNAKGAKQVEDTYMYLLAALGIPPNTYNSYTEMEQMRQMLYPQGTGAS